MDCPPKNVAVVEKWPIVEVRLYFSYSLNAERSPVTRHRLSCEEVRLHSTLVT